LVGGLLFALLAGGCGSTGGTSTPMPPRAVIRVDSWLVDVGGRYRLDATASTEPRGRKLEDTWTLVHPTSKAKFDSHCEDVPEEICTKNDDDVCAEDSSVFCTTNADCPTGECKLNSGTRSSECSTGKCLVGRGDRGAIASFVADVPGPYVVRLLVESPVANDIDTMILDTYPSLFVVGSLVAFGGTRGGLIGEFGDARTFAPDSPAGAANPNTGNVLLAVPEAGLVREFDYRTGSVVGTFGETGVFSREPVALAFDGAGRLYVADADGTVRTYDGETGLFLDTVGDVTSGEQSVRAIAVSPVTGDLLVVDGRAGEAIRVYDAATGAAKGVLGETGGAVGRAMDLAFSEEPALFIADADGVVVRCSASGTDCAPLSGASGLLEPGGPTAVAVNPAVSAVDARVLVADAVAKAVVACSLDGSSCSVFGDTVGLDSAYADLFFAPPELPTTTTTTIPVSSTTTTTVGTG